VLIHLKRICSAIDELLFNANVSQQYEPEEHRFSEALESHDLANQSTNDVASTSEEAEVSYIVLREVSANASRSQGAFKKAKRKWSELHVNLSEGILKKVYMTMKRKQIM